jgi:hypothetical protein
MQMQIAFTMQFIHSFIIESPLTENIIIICFQAL